VIVQRMTVLRVERVTVRCDECPRQVSIFVGGTGLGSSAEPLRDVGWTVIGIQHFCEEHS
jgi:hypothetical protein